MANPLDIARAEIGVREEGPNIGSRVAEYQRSVGLSPGSEWCLAFVQWCLDRSGNGAVLPETGWVPDIAKWAQDRKCWQESPLPGDLFVLIDDQDPPYYHIGFVDSIDPHTKSYRTIEGNSANAVASNTRKYGNALVRFVRWSKVKGEEPKRSRLKAFWHGYDVGFVLDGKQVWKGRSLTPGSLTLEVVGDVSE